MKNVIDKTEGLLNNPKRIIAIVILIVGIVIAFYFLKDKISALFSMFRKEIDDKQVIDEAIAETGKQPSYSDSQYRLFADRLYAAMKGFGTNEEAVYNVFRQMKSRVDVLKLIDAYGVKDGEDLLQWLNGDFWSFSKLNQILRDNNIDYTF
ncbi:MAG: annexin [Prevotellaceae bacterium]|jgi:hypothetical protein|nr:annexin [Prevotellaceae bacterium]